MKAPLPKTISECQAEWISRGHLEVLCELRVAECSLRVLGNTAELGTPLRHYFEPYLSDTSGVEAIEIVVLEHAPVLFDAPWIDWPREAGKSGLKERYHDLEGGRLVHKVRTGMSFALSPGNVVAIGPCVRNLNQVINLINNQVIGHLLSRGDQLCHAAGVCQAGVGLGMAGTSGAGKSTLALHMIDRGASFVSNDRLLVGGEEPVRMRGIPKMPRVNPGTLLHMPSLRPILSEQRVRELKTLEPSELWNLEEKYDVLIPDVFGPDRVEDEADLRALIVLSWDHRSDQPTSVAETTLNETPALLAPIEKHPGPFHHRNGVFDTSGSVGDLPRGPYLRTLGEIPLFSFTGGVDFQMAVEVCQELLKQGP